jgi:hypothetical protein
MKNSIKIFGFILISFGIVMMTSCAKDDPELPTVTTIAATSIESSSATSGGDVTSNGGADLSARGVCYSNSNASPTINDNKTTDGTSTGSYISQITGLIPGTKYYVRAYATNEVGTSYGAAIEFTTKL